MNIIYVAENAEENHKDPSETNISSRSTNPVTGIKQNAVSKLISLLHCKIKKFPGVTGVLGLAIIGGISILTLLVTCWPQHNVVHYPEYWYEPIPLFILVWANTAVTRFIQAKLLISIDDVSALKCISICYCISLVGSVMIFVSIYCLWTNGLGFPYPMPNNGIIWLFLIYLLVQPVANWMMFPSNIKKKESYYRKRIMLLLVFNLLRIIMGLGYTNIPKLPMVRYEKWQWTLAIFFLLFKKFNLKWTSSYIRWAFESDNENGTIENSIVVGFMHSQSLTIVLGSSQISKLTTFILIISDTFINGLSFKQIVKLHKQGTGIAQIQRDRQLRYLALKEFLELVVPVVYCLTFIGSYFGPNYEIIGGMGSDLWHHQKTSNPYQQLQNILLFTLIETFRGLGFGLILWRFFGLNMYIAYCSILEKFGWYIFFLGLYGNQMVSGHLYKQIALF